VPSARFATTAAAIVAKANASFRNGLDLRGVAAGRLVLAALVVFVRLGGIVLHGSNPTFFYFLRIKTSSKVVKSVGVLGTGVPAVSISVKLIESIIDLVTFR
jgi:hypothetical protein